VIDEIRTASESFWHFLSDIAILPLLVAIVCQLLKLCCTSRAWRNVLAAAYPDRPVRWPPILAAYVAGVGVNAIVPARAGDAVRIVLAHRAIPGSSYTTVVSSNIVLTFVDMALALLVFVYALTQGLLPSLDVLSSLPAFDYRWAVQDGVVRPPAVILFLAVVAGGTLLLHHFWNRLRAKVAQGFAVFDPPTRYVRTVVVWQLGVGPFLDGIRAVDATALAAGAAIGAEHLELPAAKQQAPAGSYHQQVRDFRRRIVGAVLDECGGSRAAAAARLGVSPQSISYFIRELGLVRKRR